jgi:uncharacterized protein YqfA (UPF0365 family)
VGQVEIKLEIGPDSVAWSNVDKAERKQKLAQVRAEQRKAMLASLPLPVAEMKALFDMLDSELSKQGCDHSLRLTTSWLNARNHDVSRVCEWLKSQGGFCDCEVLANVEEKVEDAGKV